MKSFLNGRVAGIVAVFTATTLIATSGMVFAGGRKNSAPVAHDQSFAASGQPIEITLHSTDADGNKLRFVVRQEPQHGTLSGQAPSFLYTPAPGYVGTDSFTWRAKDRETKSNTATVTISNTSTASSEPIEPASHVPVTFVGSTANGAAVVLDLATELTIARPAATAAGDVMYMWVAFSAPTSLQDFFAETPTVPAGWVPVYLGDPTIGHIARGVLFSKVATAAEPASYTIGFTIPTQVTASIMTFRGIDPRAPLWMVKSGTALTTLGQPLVLPSVHAPASSIEVVATTSFGASLTDPAGMTPIVRFDNDELLGLPVLSQLVHSEIQGSIQGRPVAGDTGDRIADFIGLLQPLALPIAAVGVHFTLRPIHQG